MKEAKSWEVGHNTTERRKEGMKKNVKTKKEKRVKDRTNNCVA